MQKLPTPKPPTGKTYRLQPWDEELLRQFAIYHYLTIKQVMELLRIPASSYTNATQHLKRLVDAAFLIRIERSIRDRNTGKMKRIDSSYALGKRGYAYLKREGIPTRKPRTKDGEYGVSNAALVHTPVAVDVALSFRRVAVIDNLQIYLDQWFKEHPLSIEMGGVSRVIVPDACLLFTRNGDPYICSIEIQNVENITRERLGEKAENYINLHKQGSMQRYFGVPILESVVSVLFVAVQGETAAKNIRRAIEQKLKALGREDLGPLFCISPLVEDVYAMPGLPIWQSPLDETVQPLFPS